MKRTIVTIIVGFLCMQGMFAQTEKQISAVDKQWQKIKSNSSHFKKVVKMDDSTGFSYVYLKDKELQYSTIQYNDKDIEKNVSWYFVDGKIIYCETLWVDIKTKKVIDDEKCYFNNDHLFAWIKTDNTSIDPTSKDFKDFDIAMAAYSVKLKEETFK